MRNDWGPPATTGSFEYAFGRSFLIWMLVSFYAYALAAAFLDRGTADPDMTPEAPTEVRHANR